MAFKAIINIPGYLPQNDETIEFETCAEAWAYLRDERIRDLDDPMNDEDEDGIDSALEEMEGLMSEPSVCTVYGRTPGYEGDHDLGVAYSVIGHVDVEVIYASEVRPGNTLLDWISWACCPPTLGIMRGPRS